MNQVTNYRIPVGQIFSRVVTPRMRELVNQVLDTGRLSYGPLSRQFEQQVAAIHQRRYGVVSNSGTSSLLVALEALKERYKWRNGDAVLVPSVTFVATVNTIIQARLRPVVVDVERDFYGLDPALIEESITPRTRAILPVHLFGMPCDMTTISEIAQAHDLKVIEDSCECMFVEHNGKMTGSWGDISCFSTYVAHLMTTGVGGLSLTDDEGLAILMRSLVNHGRDSIYMNIDDGRGLTGEALHEVMSRRFRFERVGHSFRITELEAALGLAQLEDWQAMITKRQSNAYYLTKYLKDYDDQIQLPRVRPHTGHAFMMYPIVCRHEHKAALTSWLEERGIETREMLPLTNQPVYASWLDEDDYPAAAWINDGGFYVGCHQGLERDDLDYMIEAITSYFAAKQARPARMSLRALVSAPAREVA